MCHHIILSSLKNHVLNMSLMNRCSVHCAGVMLRGRVGIFNNMPLHEKKIVLKPLINGLYRYIVAKAPHRAGLE